MPKLSLDVGLLVLRVTIGSMMLLGHGLPKLMTFGEKLHRFPDPIGVGSEASLTLAVFAEVVCAGLIAVGFATRLATIPLLVTMLVAALVIHGDDPWARKEFALLYAVPALTLLLTGPGKLSVDAARGKEQRLLPF
ncbi:MAG: DoxX family protein [Sandaracinaceae bacterium]|nr:MAG: DoxX family protein [Sandaracinaceae bacterium]